MGKSISLFWPHLPFRNKKLHEHANFAFGRKGFCCCVSVHACVLGLEKRLIKGTTFEWKDSFLQVTKALRKSSTIIYFGVCWVAGGWTQSTAPLEATTWSPPAVKTSELWSSGKQIRAGFPAAQLAVVSFSLFSVSRNCLSSLSSASSHLILWVSKPCSQAQKMFLLCAKQKRTSYKQTPRLY